MISYNYCNCIHTNRIKLGGGGGGAIAPLAPPRLRPCSLTFVSLPPSHTFHPPPPLPPQTQQKVLASAFLRSLKDPFPPARCAGIRAMADTHSYYLTSDVAMRLLPALCTMTVDGDKTVRDQVHLGWAGPRITCVLVGWG